MEYNQKGVVINEKKLILLVLAACLLLSYTVPAGADSG